MLLYIKLRYRNVRFRTGVLEYERFWDRVGVEFRPGTASLFSCNKAIANTKASLACFGKTVQPDRQEKELAIQGFFGRKFTFPELNSIIL